MEMFKRHFTLFLILFFPLKTFAQEQKSLSNYLTVSLGMVNVSFTESESTLKSEDDDDGESKAPGSGSGSIMSLDISYHIPLNLKYEVFSRVLIPFQPTTGNALVMGGGGMNYFFNGQSSELSANNDFITMSIRPKFRYYVGGQADFGYLIYVTESAKKSDILMEIGAQGGVLYAWKEKWGIRGEAGIGKGVGTKVSTTSMKILVGTTYNF